jgi:hypothetical protein
MGSLPFYWLMLCAPFIGYSHGLIAIYWLMLCAYCLLLATAMGLLPFYWLRPCAYCLLLATAMGLLPFYWLMLSVPFCNPHFYLSGVCHFAPLILIFQECAMLHPHFDLSAIHHNVQRLEGFM